MLVPHAESIRACLESLSGIGEVPMLYALNGKCGSQFYLLKSRFAVRLPVFIFEVRDLPERRLPLLWMQVSSSVEHVKVAVSPPECSTQETASVLQLFVRASVKGVRPEERIPLT